MADRIYITVAEVEAALGKHWSGEKSEEFVVRQANVWLNTRLSGVPEPTPEVVTIAAIQLCQAIDNGSIYGTTEREVLSTDFSAESGLHAKKTYAKGSKTLSAEQSYINDLLKPWMNKLGNGYIILGRT